ncbi:MAG TPA: OmpA family protein [Terriglobales bacterium]|nr:OmpA family protein [Terriglobales bacterium]
MKRTGLVLMILAACALAQEGAPQVAATNIEEWKQAPTYSDVNCAGYVTKEAVSNSVYLAGGWNTPHSTRFGDRDYVYLDGGGFQEGQQFKILRRLRDPNRWEPYRGQKRELGAVGDVYAEMGRVRIIGTRDRIGIGFVEFSCDAMIPGDLAIPWVERPIPQYQYRAPFNRFAPPNGLLTGRIVGAKDFDTVVGTGQKVYLNVGANQGVKVGDYFRAVRNYDFASLEAIDSLSYKASIPDDAQKHAPKYPRGRLKEFPRRSLGEMMVLNVTPTSATAMLTYAIEDVQVGDHVELMEPVPPPPPPVMNPPTIACSAQPATVLVGERSTITCEASSPDGRPLTISHASSAGTVSPSDGIAVLDTYNTSPGVITVRSTATDDRNLSATAMTNVNVEAAAVPQASKVNEIQFRRNSARVDNQAKAMLDDLALLLQREPDSRATLVGTADADEKAGATLAMQRAENARTYLVREKGVDAGRVDVKTSTTPGKKADLWVVPSGATMPE